MGFRVDLITREIRGLYVTSVVKVESALQGVIDMRPNLALLHTYLKLFGKIREAAADIELRQICTPLLGTNECAD